MTEDQKLVVSHVLMQIKTGEIVDEAKISKLVEVFTMLNPLSEQETKEVEAEVQSHIAVRMDRGGCIKAKDHVSWYYAAKGKITPLFWDRYSTYLYKYAGFNSDVINSIDLATDEMMDSLENPLTEQPFKRRGLVIGDVQSGKTSTYLALMNKAADAKYRIIILLTGTIEKLRRQTQGRTDEGFVGLDSTAFNKNSDSVWVGVGDIDQSISGFAVTSTTSDFNTSTAQKLSGKLESISSPVVFVIKKNKSVLEKLESWLRIYNVNKVTNTIDLPMLMIDDEADNASVSTKPGEDPTTINKNIRKILKLFSHSSYVGFTATPFANIFIDPDSEDEMYGDDLFPKDFIYALEPPTNYIGAARMFPEEGKYYYMLKDNSDCEEYVPLKHKKDYVPGEMPISLKKAVASFVIVNAIRDLRGQETKHRTMMINISVYVDVQKKIADQLDGYIREMQREIRNYYLNGEMALQFSSFAFIKDVYDEFFSDCEFDWPTIQKALWKAIAPIVVRFVNGGNATKNLNYDECEDDGLRLIAVGGYSLSRGLTLEGLCVSYFYRNTKMYDTLMQMGRWFGYRPHYDDICQVWINPDAVDWYSYISDASDELKQQVRRMQAENRTPLDFGLCVRSDNATLLVTARNKMRTAQDYTLTVSLSGKMVETPFISNQEKIQQENLTLTENLISQIADYKIKDKDLGIMALNDKPQYKDVPVDYILEYLRVFHSHGSNSHFHTNELVSIIEKTSDNSMNKWDVAIATGSAECEVDLGCGKIACIQRSFAVRDDIAAYQMSGSKSRLGNRQYAKAGLTAEQARKVEDGERAVQLRIWGEERPLNQDAYFRPDYFDKPRNPLLVIYPVQLKMPKDPSKMDPTERFKQERAIVNTNIPLIGISVGIPSIPGQEAKQYQYKINLIKYRELMGLDEPDEADESIED